MSVEADQAKPSPDLAVRLRGVGLFVQYVYRRFLRDRCLEAAGSLTFTTLLALVPVMFIGGGILSAVPLFEDARANLLEFVFVHLIPEVGGTALDHLDRFSRNAARTSTVGVVGLALTAVLLLVNIEAAFNAIWRVTEPRPLVWRMVAFWAVLTVGPLLVGASLSITSAFLLETPSGDAARSGLARLAPPVLEFVAFALVYTVIPNRPVRVANALVGAAVAAVLMEVVRTGFAAYVGVSAAMTTTVYGGFAAIPIFLAWVYVAWTVALIGAVTTASLAEWGARRELVGRPHLSPGGRLSVALALLAELFSASRLGVIRHRKDLLRNMNLGAFVVEAVLDDLANAKYVTRAGRDRWVLARDLEHATVYDLYWDLNLGIGTDPFRWMRPTFWQPQASDMIEAFDAAGRDAMGVTLKSLFIQRPPAGAAPEAAPAPEPEKEAT